MRFATVLLTLLFALPWPFDKLVPDWVDRYRFNPRERSEKAIEAYEAGDWDAAAELADQALDAAPPRRAREDENGEPVTPPPDPRLSYNAGATQLAAGHEKRAVEQLEQAVAAIDAGEAADLDVAARYNLGTARLAADDAAGAVQAFKEALRRDPGDADAKHNLELALKRLEEQNELPFMPPRESPEGEKQGEEEQGDSGGTDSPADQPRDDTDAADPGEGEPRSDPQQQPPQPQQGGDQEQGERPLPRFEDQPDMSAEQAAALLEAVENLERRQRQEEAAQRARRRGTGGKDW
jgi:tetratricopeptide (TPR) repeat protein